jgi:hypothetical protein
LDPQRLPKKQNARGQRAFGREGKGKISPRFTWYCLLVYSGAPPKASMASQKSA